MVVFVATDRASYRMRDGPHDVVAVHQVLTTDPWRPLHRVIAEMRPGNVFEARQYPAANTRLYAVHHLDTGSFFSYPHTLRGVDADAHLFAGDRLSLVIREILDGRSRTAPIATALPFDYCVAAGIIDEVHVETLPERQEHYRDVIGSEQIVFHPRIPHRPERHSHRMRPGGEVGSAIENAYKLNRNPSGYVVR